MPPQIYATTKRRSYIVLFGPYVSIYARSYVFERRKYLLLIQVVKYGLALAWVIAHEDQSRRQLLYRRAQEYFNFVFSTSWRFSTALNISSFLLYLYVVTCTFTNTFLYMSCANFFSIYFCLFLITTIASFNSLNDLQRLPYIVLLLSLFMQLTFKCFPFSLNVFISIKKEYIK